MKNQAVFTFLEADNHSARIWWLSCFYTYSQRYVPSTVLDLSTSVPGSVLCLSVGRDGGIPIKDKDVLSTFLGLSTKHNFPGNINCLLWRSLLYTVPINPGSEWKKMLESWLVFWLARGHSGKAYFLESFPGNGSFLFLKKTRKSQSPVDDLVVSCDFPIINYLWLCICLCMLMWSKSLSLSFSLSLYLSLSS